MSLQKPLSGLLRPPLEWYTAGIATVSSLFCLVYPDVFFLTHNFLAYPASFFLLISAGWRFKQGHRIWHYQRQLKRMPTYHMNSAQLPVSRHTLFLGKGFLWTTEHTQRLRDLDLEYNLHYKQPSRLKRWARSQASQWENRTQYYQRLAQILLQDKVWNPFRPYPLVGGQACIHGVSEREADMAISLSERASHIVVIGLPGMGKTRFAEILIGQDIRRGDVVIVLDPKGDVDLLKRMMIEAQTRRT